MASNDGVHRFRAEVELGGKTATGIAVPDAALAPSHRKEHVRAIEEAKKPETPAKRIAACVTKVRG